MLKLDKGNGAQGAPTHETTGLFFPQFVPIPGPLAGQMQLMLVPGSGIPMRDFFAVRAMQTFLQELDTDCLNFTAIARDSYRMADKMIEARKYTEDEKYQSQFHEDYLK